MSLLDWNSVVNSRHGRTLSLKVPSKFSQSCCSKVVCRGLEVQIPHLEFTFGIYFNKLMLNPNKEIRDKFFPVIIVNP